MNVTLPILASLFGRGIRNANKELEQSASSSNLKGDWPIFYAAIVAVLVLISQLCSGDVLWLSFHSQVPIYAGVLALVSPFLVFMLVVFLDFGIIGKFEMSNRTTETFLFETATALPSVWLLWIGFHMGMFEHLHWGWKLLICLAPGVVFVLSSRVAEFFRRPAVRAELSNYGHVLSMAFTFWLFDLIGQKLFGRSFLAEFVALFS